MTLTHGIPTGYNRGCRCEACTEAHREYCSQARARLAARARDGNPAVPHGAYGYTNWGCRCPVCTAANSQRCADNRRRRNARRGTDGT